MRNLLNFLARYNNLILFILFEGIAVYLIVSRNNYHNSRFVNGVRGVAYAFESRVTNTRNYLRLKKISSDMALDNARLRNELELTRASLDTSFVTVNDTLRRVHYIFTSAVITNNSVSRQKNFFTIDKGLRQGLEKDMAVVSHDGVAGIIVGRSDNFSVAMSLLNTDFRLSSRIRSSGYFGSLTWDGRDPQHAVLNEIPQHVSLAIGDTVETTSFSAIFPAGIMIGTISDFEKSGSDFYRIRVKLATDFRNLSHVSVIRNRYREEQINLENQYK